MKSSLRVVLHTDGIVRFDSRLDTKVDSVKNGLLTFSHRKHRSKRRVTRVVKTEQVLAFTATEVVIVDRVLLDSFEAVGVRRVNNRVIFDLGDGGKCTVNSTVDMEIESD